MGPERPTVEPDGVDDVEAFLDAVPGDAVVGVTVSSATGTEHVYATSVALVPRSPVTGAQAPAYTVRSNDGTDTYQAAHLVRLTAYDSPLTREEYDVAPDDARGWADGVRKAATQAPAVVNVAHPLELLGSDDRWTRRHALSALSALCRERPGDCVLTIPSLVTALEKGTAPEPSQALGCLAAIADEHPAEVAPWVGRLRAFVTSDDDRVQRAALRTLSGVAATDAAVCRDHLPALATVVEDVDDKRRAYAVYVVQRVARETPTAVEPLVPALVAAYDATDDANVAANAAIALGTLSRESPGVAVDAVGPAVRWLDAEDTVARNNAVGLLADVAISDAPVIAPYADRVRSLLDDPDDYARINATGVLARLAEDAPDSVAGDVERFVAALDDDHHLVRVNACWALGYLDARSARDRLRAVRGDDDHDEVRERAAWALDRLRAGGRNW